MDEVHVGESGFKNLQPVARVGREERTAEHQDAAQNIFLSHLERDLLGFSET